MTTAKSQTHGFQHYNFRSRYLNNREADGKSEDTFFIGDDGNGYICEIGCAN